MKKNKIFSLLICSLFVIQQGIPVIAATVSTQNEQSSDEQTTLSTTQETESGKSTETTTEQTEESTTTTTNETTSNSTEATTSENGTTASPIVKPTAVDSFTAEAVPQTFILGEGVTENNLQKFVTKVIFNGEELTPDAYKVTLSSGNLRELTRFAKNQTITVTVTEAKTGELLEVAVPITTSFYNSVIMRGHVYSNFGGFSFSPKTGLTYATGLERDSASANPGNINNSAITNTIRVAFFNGSTVLNAGSATANTVWTTKSNSTGNTSWNEWPAVASGVDFNVGDILRVNHSASNVSSQQRRIGYYRSESSISRIVRTEVDQKSAYFVATDNGFKESKVNMGTIKSNINFLKGEAVEEELKLLENKIFNNFSNLDASAKIVEVNVDTSTPTDQVVREKKNGSVIIEETYEGYPIKFEYPFFYTVASTTAKLELDTDRAQLNVGETLKMFYTVTNEETVDLIDFKLELTTPSNLKTDPNSITLEVKEGEADQVVQSQDSLVLNVHRLAPGGTITLELSATAINNGYDAKYEVSFIDNQTSKLLNIADKEIEVEDGAISIKGPNKLAFGAQRVYPDTVNEYFRLKDNSFLQVTDFRGTKAALETPASKQDWSIQAYANSPFYSVSIDDPNDRKEVTDGSLELVYGRKNLSEAVDIYAHSVAGQVPDYDYQTQQWINTQTKIPIDGENGVGVVVHHTADLSANDQKYYEVGLTFELVTDPTQ